MNNYDRYCIEICKAKCCYRPNGIPCENLGSDNKCKIYDQWKNNTCNYTGQDFRTAKIEIILANNWMKQEVRAQCCYAHPELLEVFNGD